MSMRSKLRIPKGKREKDAKMLEAKRRRLHIPGYNWTEVVDDINKKPHRRKIIKFIERSAAK